MVSRKEVADKAGVSVATVSYVVNNKPGVGDAVRRRVQSAIKELGYKPSYAARALKTKKTDSLSVLINYLGDPFEAGLLNTLEHKALEHGYLIHFHTYKRGQEEDFYRYFSGRTDGLLLFGQSLNEGLLRLLEDEGVPVISIMEPVRHDGIAAWIDVDWKAGMAAAIAHLRERGHERIGFMANGEREHPHERRYLAFLAAMSEADMQPDTGAVLHGRGRLEEAQAEMSRYLARVGPERPAAFIAASDLMAAGMLAACREAFVAVPGQMAIVGSEDIMMMQHTAPAITALHYPRPEIGALAVERMVGHLKGERSSSIRLMPELRIRSSSL